MVDLAHAAQFAAIHLAPARCSDNHDGSLPYEPVSLDQLPELASQSSERSFGIDEQPIGSPHKRDGYQAVTSRCPVSVVPAVRAGLPARTL
jgi:hypothetical protein